ncbi:MAG TPA: hypothetical protein VK849_10905 [Longimicrobiales bacterium]|nr:hypothetical protein [Longimicrobiales bacterium]
MSILIAVLLVLLLGGALTFGAVRATASVQRGRTFIRWMVVVFVAYVALISIPVVIGI